MFEIYYGGVWMNFTDEQLYTDMVQINERLLNLEIAFENILGELNVKFINLDKETGYLQNRLAELNQKIVSKLKHFEDKTVSSNKLNSLIGRDFPLKHEIMQEKFNLNEECSEILRSFDGLKQELKLISYKIQGIYTCIQSLKTIRNMTIQLENNLSRKINPDVFSDPFQDYQPIYMIQETLNQLNEITETINSDPSHGKNNLT